MNAKILARAPFDQWTFDFFSECVPMIPEQSDVYYVWSDPAENIGPILNGLEYNNANVFIFIPEDLNLYDFNPWTESITMGVRAILEIVNRHLDKKFVIITDVIDLQQEIKNVSNLRVVQTEFITTEHEQYQHLPAVADKNFNSDKSYIFLNNRPAAHRVSAVGYLLYHGWDKHGLITISKFFHDHVNKYESYLDFVGWQFSPEQESTIKPILLDGFKQLQTYPNYNDEYVKIAHQNVNNYQQHLIPRYQNSFVEIVPETYFAEPSSMLTEKTLNSVYGCNFPIFLATPNLVGYLRNLGLDMFDDVIDHSYDQLTNVFDRMTQALKLNQRLLVDVDYAKSCWQANQQRFLKNVDFVRHSMYKTIHQRARDQFKSAVEWVNAN